ncbi:uncharacterized protein [Amphiura filiformis]|uniref:uncharacterized protein n=1 Tax=Amphiura filiformis TaxID=82378 RepID=UPI003B221224
MERFERLALQSYNGTPPTHWFRYVDDTLLKLKKSEQAPFFEHINDENIRKIPSTEEAKLEERNHLKSALGTCGYQNWTFEKALKAREKSKPISSDSSATMSTRPRNITIPYIAGVSEKLKRIFGKHNIPVSLKPGNTLRQKLVHPKDKPPRNKQSNIVYAIQCKDSDCEDSYIGESKQPLHKRMYQHRRPSSTGLNDSAVYTHLKFANHSFEDKDVLVLDREHKWFERGVKEAIHVRREEPSLNRGGGLRHNLSRTYDAAIRKLPGDSPVTSYHQRDLALSHEHPDNRLCYHQRYRLAID